MLFNIPCESMMWWFKALEWWILTPWKDIRHLVGGNRKSGDVFSDVFVYTLAEEVLKEHDSGDEFSPVNLKQLIIILYRKTCHENPETMNLRGFFHSNLRNAWRVIFSMFCVNQFLPIRSLKILEITKTWKKRGQLFRKLPWEKLRTFINYGRSLHVLWLVREGNTQRNKRVISSCFKNPI